MMKDSDYIRHLKIIEQMANDVGKNVRTEIRNPKNKYVYDARVSTFFLIAQVVRWFKISLILKEERPNDPRWYKN